jgi:purine-binding chemotaxis protein CheW
VSIILETSGGPVALLVDSVGEILSLLPAELEPPPNKLTELAKEVVTGVYIRPEQLLLILDPLKIVSGATRESPVTPSK